MSDEKIGLVLAGGGAKGSYQAEVASRIYKDVGIDFISGVSVGALNGSILASGRPDQLRAIWALSRKKDVWSGGFIRYVKAALGMSLGFYDPSPLIETVKKHFDPNDIEIPMKAGAVRLSDGEYTSYEIRPHKTYTQAQKRRLRRAVVASSAVPVGVEPVKVDEHLMIDGGTRNMAPAGSAIDEDCDRVIAVFNSRLDNKNSRKDNSRMSNIVDVGKWAIEILLNETIRSDVRMTRAVNEFVDRTINQEDLEYKKVPVHVIEPSENLGDVTDFSRQAWARRTKLGEEDAKQFLNQRTL